jgi:hypothetical protein
LKLHQRVWMREVRQHHLWMHLRIADHVRHPCLLPTRIRCGVASLAALRSDIVPLGRHLSAADRCHLQQV